MMVGVSIMIMSVAQRTGEEEVEGFLGVDGGGGGGGGD